MELLNKIQQHSKNILKTAAIGLFCILFSETEAQTTTPLNLKDIKQKAHYHDDLGKKFLKENDLDAAFENYLEALKGYEQTKEIMGRRGTTKAIAKIYQRQEQRKDALKRYKKSLEIIKDTSYQRGELLSKIGIGEIFLETNQPDSALAYLLPGGEVLKNQKDKDDKAKNLEAQYLIDIGNAYSEKLEESGNEEKAVAYRQAAEKISEEIGAKHNLAIINFNYGDIKKRKGEYQGIDKFYLTGLEIGQELNEDITIRDAYFKMYEYCKGMGDYKNAMMYHEKRSVKSNEIATKEGAEKQKRLEIKYQTAQQEAQIQKKEAQLQKKDKEIKLQKAENERQQLITFAIIIGGLLIIIIVSYGLRANNKQKKLERKSKEIEKAKNKELGEKNAEITQQNEEITAQRDEIEAQRDSLIESKKIIEEKNKEITASIMYAKRIQEKTFTPKKVREAVLPQHFMVFKPKDIVSGDFYRFCEASDGTKLWSAADCTGHGVPGSYGTFVGGDAMKDSARLGYISPAKILNRTNEEYEQVFNQVGEGDSPDRVKDGMDLMVCSYNPAKKKLVYAGANNDGYLIRNNTIIVLEAERQAIGMSPSDPNFKEYVDHEIDIQEGDVIYLCSDGFQDQFGGPKGKKFMKKNLKELFLKIAQLEMEEQRRIIETALAERKENGEQVDDITIIGARL